MTRWPCSTCDAPGVRNIGTKGYCSTHLLELYTTISPEAFSTSGVGLPCGVLQPDLGPCIEELRCSACGASWCGLAGEACWWCERSRQIQLDHQAELVLTPPDVNPDDTRYEAMTDAWSGRLRIAVDAGIVEDREAVAAMRREGKRAA